MKNIKTIIFLALFSFSFSCMAQSPKYDQTGYLNLSSGPAFWGSCFAVLRKEAQLKDPATESIAVEAVIKIVRMYANPLKQYRPDDYLVFMQNADRLNSINAKDMPTDKLTTAFLVCGNRLQEMSNKTSNN